MMTCLRPSSHTCSSYGSFINIAANSNDDDTDEEKILHRQILTHGSPRLNLRLIASLCVLLVVVSALCIPKLAGTVHTRMENQQRTSLDYRESSAFSWYFYEESSIRHPNGDDQGYSYPYCQPKRIHLAQASNVDEHNDSNTVSMTVSFSISYEDYHDASSFSASSCRSTQPQIVYGTGFDAPQTAIADKKPKQFNYTSDETTNGIFQSDYIFHVELPNLQAGHMQYWYRIQMVVLPPASSTATSEGDLQTTTSNSRHLMLRQMNQNQQDEGHQQSQDVFVLASSPTFRFRTPPLPGAPTSIALVGDLGQTYNSTSTAFHIWQKAMLQQGNTHYLSHLLIAGDMSYADSDPFRWISWFDLMEPLLRTLPVHVAAGNHEVECNTNTLDIFVPYEHYFYNPNRIRDAEMKPITDEYRQTLWHASCSSPSQFQGRYVYGNSFYSYIVGLVHVIVLNSYTAATEGSIQYAWLQNELQQNVNRTKTPWLMVSFHAPLYTTFVGHVDEIEAVQMRRALESLFLQYNVNLVVSGHDHAYMRTHSLAFGRVDPTGASPVYLTLGAGGNREQHSAGYRHDKPEDWVAARSLEDYGFGHLLAINATHAYFEWVRDGISETGIQDQVWFINPHV